MGSAGQRSIGRRGVTGAGAGALAGAGGGWKSEGEAVGAGRVDDA
ncbi:hypothetical protein SCE1572_01865 [Sorangium cellulosum So0157-2]|uniref:Uncharacterized protein n=1 Tax=Sorangium cellulosum So0157-2 TaxID=1254432 RepID=S4XLL3_SORCE|nr:hypothetical protein SCE1572_01865 [Sorangium cellulosum So0157-2]